jgi:hypothetical protein
MPLVPSPSVSLLLLLSANLDMPYSLAALVLPACDPIIPPLSLSTTTASPTTTTMPARSLMNQLLFPPA